MKTFIYTKRERNVTHGRLVDIDVYQLKRNKPIFIGAGQYNTASTKGDDSEAYAVIVERKLLSKKAYLTASGYYYRATGDFKIFSV